MMRIGIEAQRIFRKKRHGMDMVVIELIQQLQSLDKTNSYFVFVNEMEDPGIILETHNFKIIPLKKSSYPVWEQIHLPKAAEKYQIDILHCTSNTAPWSCRSKLVLTLHDIIYLEKIKFNAGTWYQRLGNLYRRWNVPGIVKKADMIFTVSHYEQKKIMAHFGLNENQVKVTYNGVSPHFKPVGNQVQLEIKNKYQLPESFMLFLGNTDPKKNLKGVLSALQLLHESGSSFPDLVMPDFGEPVLRKMLNDIGAIALLAKIKLTGYIPNKDLPAIYAQAKLFLYPSLRESFGIPILEAMACGCPVITSNTSSMPEVAGDAALLVDPFQPEQIKAAIEELLSSTEVRENWINKGFKRPPLFNYREGALKVMETYLEIYGHHDG
ncbi:MAG: glycosyltransferase family 1 protein [Cyclobacteriaceae bacterium]